MVSCTTDSKTSSLEKVKKILAISGSLGVGRLVIARQLAKGCGLDYILLDYIISIAETVEEIKP